MKITCDLDSNVAYIRLRERQGEVETIELTSDVLIDIEANGAISGIELLDANEVFGASDNDKLIIVDRSCGGQTELGIVWLGKDIT